MGYVYKITCIPSGKSYIGISIHDPNTKRIKDHFSGHGNRVIANAVKKYGKDAFVCEILEENVFPEFLPDLEIAYIKRFNTVRPNGFNLTSGGEVAKKVSDETRKKISEAQKGKKSHHYGKKGEKSYNYGRKHTAETRRKMSKAHKGEKHHFYGKKHTPESLRKMSEAQKGKKLSDETRKKMSIVRTGKTAHNKGKKLSDETRRKISEGMAGEKNHKYGKRRSYYAHVKNFFLSLPDNLQLTEKRQKIFEMFPDIPKSTIYDWVRKDWT